MMGKNILRRFRGGVQTVMVLCCGLLGAAGVAQAQSVSLSWSPDPLPANTDFTLSAQSTDPTNYVLQGVSCTISSQTLPLTDPEPDGTFTATFSGITTLGDEIVDCSVVDTTGATQVYNELATITITDQDVDQDGVGDFTQDPDPTKPDADGDGLLDYEEINNVLCADDTIPLDTSVTNCATDLSAAYSDLVLDPASADTDDDGLSDYEEVTDQLCSGTACLPMPAGISTQPHVADSDSDCLTDWEEFNACRSDGTTYENGGPNCLGAKFVPGASAYLNPTNNDTDGGGEFDGAEVAVGRNPLEASDDDPMSTGNVLCNGSGSTDTGTSTDAGTDGTIDPSTQLIDRDNDGLYDWEELNACFVSSYAELPLEYPADCSSDFPDFDNDGTPDTTDAFFYDSDNDGLSDFDEIRAINGSVTNPNNPDTDGGGVSDYDEVETNSTDPNDATDDIVLTAGEFVIVKTTVSPQVQVGDVIDYQLTIQNPYDEDVTDFIALDPLQEGLIFLDTQQPTQVAASVDPVTGNDVVTVFFDALPQGVSVVNFRVTVGDLDGAVDVCNQVTIANGFLADASQVDADTSSRPCSPVKDIVYTIEKIAEPLNTPLRVTDKIKYTFRLTNPGALDLYNVVINDPLPYELVFLPDESDANFQLDQDGEIVFTAPILDFNSTKEFSFTAFVQGLPADGTLCNRLRRATAYETETPGDTTLAKFGELPGPACAPVVPSGPDVQIIKSSDVAVVAPGEAVTFTITAINTGTDPLTQLRIEDILDSRYWSDITPSDDGVMVTDATTNQTTTTWNLTQALPRDGSRVLTISATPTVNAVTKPEDTDGNIRLSNTVFLYTAETGDDFHSATDTVIFVRPDQGIIASKSLIPPTKTPVVVGDELIYVITLQNVTGEILDYAEVTDMLPPEVELISDPTATEVTLEFFNVPAAIETLHTREISVRVTQTPTQENGICNDLTLAVGQLGAQVIDGLIASEPVCTESVAAEPQLMVNKSSEQHDTVVEIYEAFAFTLTAENTGNVPLTNVELRDEMPDVWQVLNVTGADDWQMVDGELVLQFDAIPVADETTEAAEQLRTVTVQALANEAIYACNGGGNLGATAQFLGETYPAQMVMGQVCINASDSFIGGSNQFIRATKSVNTAQSPNKTNQGAEVTFTILVKNKSADDVTNVVVTDALPSTLTFVRSANNAVSHANGVVTANLGTLTPVGTADAQKAMSFVAQVAHLDNAQMNNFATVATTVAGVAQEPVTTNIIELLTTTQTQTTTTTGTNAGTNTNSNAGSNTNTNAGTSNVTYPNQGSSGAGGGSSTKFVPFTGASGSAETTNNNSNGGTVAVAPVVPAPELPPVEQVIEPEKPFCTVTVCPACLSAQTMEIEQKVYDHAPEVNGWRDAAAIVHGDTIDYRATLRMSVTNDENYDLTDGVVYFYDVTVPDGDARLFGRELLSNQIPWEQVTGAANKHKVNLRDITQDGVAGLDILNAGSTLSIPVEYQMQTELVEAVDISRGVKAAAFAVAVLEYTDLDGNVAYHVTGPDGNELSEDQCLNPIDEQLVRSLVQPGTAAFATLGDTTQIDVIRPVVAGAQGASLGVDSDAAEGQLFGTKIPEALIHEDYREMILYIDEVPAAAEEAVQQASFADLQSGLADRLLMLDELKDGAVQTSDLTSFFPELSSAGYFKKAEGQSIYFFSGNALMLDGQYQFNQPITIVLENADLVYESDVSFADFVPAFVLQRGDVLIENDVSEIGGAVILASSDFVGGLISYDENGVSESSRLPLVVRGVIAGGDPQALIDSRYYLGANPLEQGVEPSIEIIPDARLLSDPPPGLSDILSEQLGQN